MAFADRGSKSDTAVVKASAWLVEPPAVRPATASFRSATEVMSCVSAVAVLAKLTIPIRLPEPMVPSAPSVASSMISINVSAPAFMFSRGLPAMLPDRSSTRTISAGLAEISGAAERARLTFSVPSQSICDRLISLLEFVIPIVVLRFL